MQITPLCLHAAVQIPRYTSVFSQALPVSTISVVAGGNTTLNCSSPHGVAVNSRIAVSITDADSPNGIVAAEVLGNSDVLLTTAFDHDLTGTTDPERFQAWDMVCKLAGFTDSKLNGVRQLVEVKTRRQIVVKPGGTVASVALNGNEVLLERIELGLVGWHVVTATTASALIFETPAAVVRSYTIATPNVVRDFKIFGARDPQAAFRQYTEDGNNLTPNRAAMFICPEAAVVAERANGAYSGPGVDFRQRLGDGFSVVVFLPSAGTVAHVKCIDLAQGEIFRAVLRSFYGLRLPRHEVEDPGQFTATFHAHGSASLTNNAIYVHKYDFDMPAYIGNADAIAPWEWSDFGDGTAPPTDVVPIGAPPLDAIDFTGILHDGMPQPLYGTFKVEE